MQNRIIKIRQILICMNNFVWLRRILSPYVSFNDMAGRYLPFISMDAPMEHTAIYWFIYIRIWFGFKYVWNNIICVANDCVGFAFSLQIVRFVNIAVGSVSLGT